MGSTRAINRSNGRCISVFAREINGESTGHLFSERVVVVPDYNSHVKFAGGCAVHGALSWGRSLVELNSVAGRREPSQSFSFSTRRGLWVGVSQGENGDLQAAGDCSSRNWDLNVAAAWTSDAGEERLRSFQLVCGNTAPEVCGNTLIELDGQGVVKDGTAEDDVNAAKVCEVITDIMDTSRYDLRPDRYNPTVCGLSYDYWTGRLHGRTTQEI